MKDKIYLGSINYQVAGQLLSIVDGDHNLYRVLDAILFCWQNSSYRDDGKKVACPKLSRLAELASMSVSSIKRQMKKLKDMGFIGTKIKKVYNGSTRCFFWVCDKVLDIIGAPKQINKKRVISSTPNVKVKKTDKSNLSYSASSNWSTLIYKVNTIKIKNNNKSSVKNVADNQEQGIGPNIVNKSKGGVIVNFDNDKYLIKKNLTKRQVSLVTGMIDNLINQGVKISNPKEIKKQVVFKIEKKHIAAGGNNLKHQINSAAKLIRTGKWTTPFGFYKYSDYGIKLRALKEQENILKEKDKGVDDKRSSFIQNNNNHVNNNVNNLSTKNSDSIYDEDKINGQITLSHSTNTYRGTGLRKISNYLDLQHLTSPQNTIPSRVDKFKLEKLTIQKRGDQNNKNQIINRYKNAIEKMESEESRIALQGVIDRMILELQS